MAENKYLAKILICFLVFLLFSQSKVYAYLDPGSGSYFFQFIVATLLGAVFSIKLFSNKIKSFLVMIFSKKRRHNKDGK